MSAEIIRIFILLAIFAAVFLLAQVSANTIAQTRSHRGAINRRLQMISAGQDREAIVGKLIKNRPKDASDLPEWVSAIVSKSDRMIFAANLPFAFWQMAVFMGLGTAAIFLVTLLLLAFKGTPLNVGTFLIVALFSILAAIGLPLLVFSRMAESRKKRMEQQFPVALDIFVRALRSGHPIASAIDLLTKEMEDPIGTEFGLISDEVAYGADLIGALEHMADRWDLDDMKMFVVSLSVQSQTGGNLAEILENISKVIRERHQMFMKVRALSSEGRMTGWMLTVLPIFAFVSIFAGTPSYYLDQAADPIFIYGAVILGVMYFLGVYIIRRLVDVKV
ncbi:MAG TPA: secretion system protein [Erythrobacter sp.]|nr:secretion system protein [Erythrobacter sp.]